MKTINPISITADPVTRRHIRNVGLVLTIIGFIAILIPQFVTLAVEALLAWLLIFAGAAGLFFSWQAREFLGWWYTGVTFLLTLTLGIVFLVFPFSGIAAMTIFLVALFVLEGLVSLLLGSQFRKTGVNNWFWMIFSGISSIVIAIMIMVGWPGSADWAIGLLIGLNFLTTGLSLLLIASTANRSSV